MINVDETWSSKLSWHTSNAFATPLPISNRTMPTVHDSIGSPNPFLTVCFAAKTCTEQLTRYGNLVQQSLSSLKTLQSYAAEACGAPMLSLVTTVINHDGEVFEMSVVLTISCKP